MTHRDLDVERDDLNFLKVNHLGQRQATQRRQGELKVVLWVEQINAVTINAIKFKFHVFKVVTESSGV